SKPHLQKLMRARWGAEFSRFLPLATDEGESPSVGGPRVPRIGHHESSPRAVEDIHSKWIAGGAVASCRSGHSVLNLNTWVSELRLRGIGMDTSAHASYATKRIIGKVADVLRDERATATNIESVVDKAAVDRDEVIAEFGSMHGLIL